MSEVALHSRLCLFLCPAGDGLHISEPLCQPQVVKDQEEATQKAQGAW